MQREEGAEVAEPVQQQLHPEIIARPSGPRILAVPWEVGGQGVPQSTVGWRVMVPPGPSVPVTSPTVSQMVLVRG